MRTLRLEYGRLAQKKAEIIEYSKNEPTLFGGIKGIGMKATKIWMHVITKNPTAVGQYGDTNAIPSDDSPPFTAAEQTAIRKVWAAAEKYEATKPIGAPPINWYWADFYKNSSFDNAPDIVFIEGWKVTNFPSMVLQAEYPDGSRKWFKLNTDITDFKNYTADEIATRLNVLAKGKEQEGGASSWLCELFPPLCSVGKYAWLGLVGFAAYKAFTEENKNKRLVFSAAALVAGNEFISRGGLKALNISSSPQLKL